MKIESEWIGRTAKSALLGTGALALVALLSGCPAPQEQEPTEAPPAPTEAPVETP